MHKKIDMAMFSILRAYAARVYKSTKAQVFLKSDQAVKVKSPLVEQTQVEHGQDTSEIQSPISDIQK